MKKSIWTISVFYALIALEMLYMAGPFAAYFYGVYSPVLNFFNNNPTLAMLNSFFLPHIARESSSFIINIHEYIGAVLAILGFITFLMGASQIYYHKFLRKGAVTKGIYQHIRHPQYLSFAICGFGLLILWPRVINLLMYVTMLFVYYILAKIEEHECEEKFQQSYIDYKDRTNMFLPLSVQFSMPSLPKSLKISIVICVYILSLLTSAVVAKEITNYSINNLYALYADNSAIISLSRITSDKLNKIVEIAIYDKRMQSIIDNRKNEKLIIYVLPSEWYAAEVPMNGLQQGSGHLSPSDYDDTQYKVIVTSVRCRDVQKAMGKHILLQAMEREPLAEAWVDLKKLAVTRLLEIPDNYKYRGIPVAVY
jgi:protein-S-isoprenylcysteine O-methyltransferase Ste14